MSMTRMLMAGASVLLFSGCGTSDTSCLARGTRVKTPDGWKPIERLEVGDAVLCWDHDELDYVETVVTATKQARREVVALAVGNMRLRMTADHPVWSPEKNDSKPAEEWVEGNLTALLRTTRGTELVEVTDRLAYDGVTEVYDITVEHELHNFVADGFVVHNKSAPLDPCSIAGGFSGDACACPSGDETGYQKCLAKTGDFCVCSDGDFPIGDASDSDAGTSADGGASDDAGGSEDSGMSDAN
jgi:hypothetical protein